MGRRVKKNIKYTEEYILDILNQVWFNSSTKKYVVNNLFVFGWESDYLCLTKSGYFYEAEIKISRSDFKQDKKKKLEKHLLLENKEANELKPNYFYYAVPQDLILVDEIPEYAGLIYITDSFPYINIVKQAPELHRNKVDASKLNLGDKFYYNMWGWKNKCAELKKEIKCLNEKLDKCKYDSENGITYKYTLNEYDKIVNLYKDEIDYLRYKNSVSTEDCDILNKENRKLKKLLKENNIKYDNDEI